MYDLLFQPAKINKLTLKNRLLMIPMHTLYSENNRVSERDIEYLRKRAEGGAAAIYVSTAVAKRGLLYGMHLLDSDDCIEGFSKLADVLHEHDCKLFTQLFHCGRCGNQKTLQGLTPLAPSAVPSRIYKETPQVMTKEDIAEAREQFISAAKRAKAAGVDGVEISVSVGYLLPEFLSEVTNQRTDEYGGSEENRFRFPLEVFRGVREAVGPDYPVMMRLSAAQMDPNGYDINVMIRFCKALEAEGLLDMVSVTGGWHEAPLPLITFHVPPAGYAFMVDTIRREIKSPVLVSTRINEGKIAEQMLKDGIADFVGMARPFLADPDIVNKIRAGVPFNKCQGCSRGCNERTYIPADVTCVFNPEVGKEYLDIKHPGKSENSKKHILVAGAGPAGLYAAVKAAKKGYKVTLATDENRLGGALYLASIPPRKQDIMAFIENKAYELEQLKVDVRLNTAVDEALIREIKPDQVVVAVGGHPFVPPVQGLNKDKENVHFALDVLEAGPELLTKLKAGKTVVIGGGSVGLETAIFLSEKGMGGPQAVEFYFHEVAPMGLPAMQKFVDITIVEMAPKIGADLRSIRRFTVADAKRLEIKMMTETKVVAVNDKTITVESPEGQKELPYDNIILAAGNKPNEPEFIKYLEKENIPYTKLGDAVKAGSAMNATASAFEWSLTI